MFNINAAAGARTKDDKIAVRDSMKIALGGFDPCFVDVNGLAAQIAANLIDFCDSDSNVTAVNDVDGNPYYGFERPCIYISELARNFVPDLLDPATIYRSYAVELYKPYPVDNDPWGWRLVIDGSPVGIDWLATKQFHVILWQNDGAPLPVDPNAEVQTPLGWVPGDIIFDAGRTVALQRFVADVGYITVDSIPVPDWLVEETEGIRSFQRDITRHKCIRRLWDDSSLPPSLGSYNTDVPDTGPPYIQAHPANRGFTNVGQIGMIFRRSAYGIDPCDTEANVRIDLADPDFQQIFNYLTVFDPTNDGIDNDGDGLGEGEIDGGELKIPGRININTAPWYVIAQLPWVSYDESNPGAADYRLARAIVAYRDKLDLSSDGGPDYLNNDRYDVIEDKIPDWLGPEDIREQSGFASIGELAFVLNGDKDEYNEYSIDKFSKDNDDLDDFPDLTQGDGAEDDFEERDVIFARISNLVTVRSDVFTAYILVRIGADGPQKRVVAILDRSDVYPGGGKVKVRALHPAADPR
jgi:hypothetical protein